MCGSLKLDVARLVTDGVLTWLDTLHPAQPLAAADAGEVRTRTARSRQHVGARQHNAVSCLQVCFGADMCLHCAHQCCLQLVEEPRYERGTGELLAPALVDSALLLPGGAAAARRRAAAQASVGEWVDGSGAAETPQPKRRRVGLNKCHNCGSYKHSMNKCPAPYDQVRLEVCVYCRPCMQKISGGVLACRPRHKERAAASSACTCSRQVQLLAVRGLLSTLVCLSVCPAAEACECGHGGGTG